MKNIWLQGLSMEDRNLSGFIKNIFICFSKVGEDKCELAEVGFKWTK